VSRATGRTRVGRATPALSGGGEPRGGRAIRPLSPRVTGGEGRGEGGRLRLRRARLSDAPAIAAVMSAAIRGLASGVYPARSIARWASLPPLYHAWAMTAGGERTVVAVRGGRVAGYAALRGREVTAVFVHPRLARRGVGSALLRVLERDAARAGATRLVVRAALSALAFYEAAGFSGGRVIAVPLPGGGALPARLLARRLPARAPAAEGLRDQSRPQGRRKGQRRQASRSSRRGKVSSRATLRAGSASAARMSRIEARMSSWQRSRVAGSAATETRSPPATPFPTR